MRVFKEELHWNERRKATLFVVVQFARSRMPVIVIEKCNDGTSLSFLYVLQWKLFVCHVVP